ncbi:MAG: 4-hydroxy-tetrahydrodipicolinate synthase [Kiritimatiellae bacterium]|nr:4-hydroxy-tetrahydrodipicolinate synthase [Kiritimatiellia bacterium]
MKTRPHGIIPPLVTPLDRDLRIDTGVLRELIRHVLAGGVHGIFLCGTTGEFYGFDPDEKRVLFETAVAEVRGRVPVYAGTGAIATREVLALTRMAEAVGVNAVSVLTPMFVKPTQDELFAHYQAIAESTTLPVLLYNNPAKTGVNLDVRTIERLAALDNIVGIKDSSGDFTRLSEYIRATRGADFAVLSGKDTLIHACLCHGGAGAVAASANVAPRLCADIYDRHVAGDTAAALAAQERLAPLRMAFELGTFPAVIKEALDLVGIRAGPCLAPVGRLGDEQRANLRRILARMGLTGEALT